MEPPRTQQVFTVTRPDSVAGVPACVCPLVRQVADHPGTGTVTDCGDRAELSVTQ